ncbi:MAG TPA: fibronectin type III domain-containing protein [Candidatus Angelobacter sp.]|nr:fibronectin type III domain-containing protein [Candidatus Angelobacter sp.]
MRKAIRGFTIIELLVVVSIMGILTTVGIISFSRIQSDSRDSQRSSKITVIAEALEKYYDENGEYPSCNAMTQSPETVTTETLTGIDPEVLATPRAESGTNSILASCANLTSTTDAFAYVGDGSSDCLNGEACSQYTLNYQEESTGNIISLSSRHALPAPSSAPTNLLAITASSTSINVSWDAVSGATSYTLQRDTSSSFNNPTAITQPGIFYLSSSLPQGTKYYYRVQSTISNETSGWSTTTNATTTIDAPTGLVAAVVSSTSINVSWDVISGATSYILQRDTSASFTSPTITTQADITFLSSGLSQGVKYYYRVQATSINGYSGWSTIVNATTTIDAPAAPTVTKITINATTTWSWPTVTCPAGTTARYQYRYTITPSGSDSGWVATASSPVVFTTNTVGQTYIVAVQAQCFLGSVTSGWSTPGQASHIPKVCATGYVSVHGSFTYGVSDFCVMKYEAKNVGGVATSQAALSPWTWIRQTAAITASNAACDGCHLITEAEWMTIAQNIMSVSSNWSGGSVGSGYTYSGHSDDAPVAFLAADANDANGYSGTGNFSGDSSVTNGMIGNSQRRTLTLTNGQVIWDLAGNVWDWTSGTSQSPIVQPGVSGGGGAWREWNTITNPGTVSPNQSPASTGIAGASTWTSAKGIGQVWSSTEDATLRGFVRGGNCGSTITAGVFSVSYGYEPTFTHQSLGFRVAF